jgi:predicted TIM-barrel fold metal-dependent hydrolase
MRYSGALRLEDVLVRHPGMRIYVMHAGWPLGDDMVGLVYSHPHVYVDIGVIDWVLPKPEFRAYLKRLIDAGFGKRIMFGSDQMVWPDAIDAAVAKIAKAKYLSAAPAQSAGPKPSGWFTDVYFEARKQQGREYKWSKASSRPTALRTPSRAFRSHIMT